LTATDEWPFPTFVFQTILGVVRALGFHPVSVEMPLALGPRQAVQSSPNAVPEKTHNRARITDKLMNVKPLFFIRPPVTFIFSSLHTTKYNLSEKLLVKNDNI
jgi:hypothetical protein